MLTRRQVERSLRLPFTEMAVLIIAGNWLTAGWEVCIDDDMVMAGSLIHPFRCWLNGHSHGFHPYREGAGNLSAVLRLNEERPTPLCYINLDGISDCRVLRDVVALCEQQAEGMLTGFEVQYGLRLPFTEMAMICVRRDGPIEGR